MRPGALGSSVQIAMLTLPGSTSSPRISSNSTVTIASRPAVSRTPLLRSSSPDTASLSVDSTNVVGPSTSALVPTATADSPQVGPSPVSNSGSSPTSGSSKIRDCTVESDQCEFARLQRTSLKASVLLQAILHNDDILCHKSTTKALRAGSMTSSSQPSNGSTGSTTDGCTTNSAASHQPTTKPTTIVKPDLRTPQSLYTPGTHTPGAVQENR